MEHGLIILIIPICLFLGVVAVSALILWIRDQGGPQGEFANGLLMVLMVVTGLVCLVHGTRSLIVHSEEFLSRDFVYNLWTLGLLFLGLRMVWGFGKWLIGPLPGIEKQELDFRSPELVEAVKKAKDTLPAFIERVRQHIDGAYIRFPHVTDEGVTEHVWAYVRHFEDGIFNVSPVNERDGHEKEFPKRRDVPEGAVEDWKIIQSDGRIKGAYSYIGAFQYLERTGVKLNRTLRKQRSQIVDTELAVPTQ